MIRLFSLSLLLFCAASWAAPLKILILGDSLSAGYQMKAEQSWPTLFPEAMQKYGHQVNVINASISGDTTGNGLSRLPALLATHQPDWVLIELGANDGLRGFPVRVVSSNISQIINLSKESGAKVALMQIRIPPNYGKRYSDAFYDLYPKLAQHQHSILLPFFLEQVILKPEWMRSDGLHPNAKAQPWIADYVAQHFSRHLAL